MLNREMVVWWHKLARGERNVNALTSQALTDMGRAPTFYDCLVEIEAASPIEASAGALSTTVRRVKPPPADEASPTA